MQRNCKKCKVSTATVSFVLNNKNKKGISIATWNKVEKVFEKYGYIKNKKKTSLKKIIFLLTSDLENLNINYDLYVNHERYCEMKNNILDNHDEVRSFKNSS